VKRLLTADDCARMSMVRARRAIRDTPLASVDASTHQGIVGEVCDVDYCAEPPIVFVDFGADAIACTPDELWPDVEDHESKAAAA
jgi:hypothetical protein